MKKEKIEYITQKTLISWGWTDKMIQELLPEPRTAPNPHYRCAGPMRLWDKKLVMQIMATDEFAAALEKANIRKASAKKGVETKKANLIEMAIECGKNADITILDDEVLRERVVQSHEEYHLDSLYNWIYYLERKMTKREISYGELLEIEEEIRETEYEIDNLQYKAPNAPELFNKWIVNYIRHNLTRYDNILYGYRGRVGVDEAYYYLKENILLKIAEVYPAYANECYRQIRELKRESSED